jgi:4-amino-4-deoxy-L-arabinose transferase-like glycosyltransferase
MHDRPSDSQRFWRILLLVVLAALALRVGYVMLAKRTEPVLGDQIYYNYMANQLARGEGFTDPRDGSEQAEHPPLAPMALAPTSWVAERFDEGGRHLLAHRLTMTVFGAAVVLVIGMVGRSIAGDRAGLIAAVIAAVYPNLWINDGLVMAETLAALAVALAILLAYRFLRAPSPANAAWLGAVCGLAMLVRSELGLLLPLMVLPIALFSKALPFLRQVLLFLLACVVAFAVVSPWLIANVTRFEEPVLFSTNDGLTICGANHQFTWYGEGTGLWVIDCANYPVPEGDRSVTSNALRREGVQFIRDHLDRLPVVVATRVARVWSLYAPGLMADYNTGEGRDVEASWAGFLAFWALVPCAIVGGVVLRRRRVWITPLVAQFVIVTITAAAIYGLVRFRVPAEVSLVVLAAVAVEEWWRRRSDASPDAEPDVTPDDVSRPAAVEAPA